MVKHGMVGSTKGDREVKGGSLMYRLVDVLSRMRRPRAGKCCIV